MNVKTSMSDITGNVIRVREYADQYISGTLAELEVENYGNTQDYFFRDGTITVTEEERRQQLSKIPVEYAGKYAKDFNFELYGSDISAQKKIANSFVLNFKKYLMSGNGLYIFSKTKGTGKTMLACVLANELIKKSDACGLNVKYVTAQGYIEMIRERTGEAYTYKDCTLLIFDDIGSETSREDSWTKAPVFDLVNYRYSNHLPTIYTSNFPMDELKEDERTIDRIVSSSAPIALPNVPIRRQQGLKEISRFMRETEKDVSENIFD